MQHKVVKKVEEQENYRHRQGDRGDFRTQVRVLSESAVAALNLVVDDVTCDYEVKDAVEQKPAQIYYEWIVKVDLEPVGPIRRISEGGEVLFLKG